MLFHHKMDPRERLIRDCYAAFNAGEYGRLPEYLAPDVEWPNLLEGTMLHGPDAVITYWEQVKRVHLHHYEVKHVEYRPTNTVVVTLLRTLKSPQGALISQGLIRHVLQIRDGRVSKMDVMV